MKKSLFIAAYLFLLSFSYAQTEQIEYLEAKRLFNNGQYLTSKAAFGSLITSPVFGKHASFYGALSAYHLQDYRAAEDALSKLNSQYPNWDQHQEVLYWLAVVNFGSEDYEFALQFIHEFSEISRDTKIEEALISEYCGKLKLTEIRLLSDVFPDNKFLAKELTTKLLEETGANRDVELIQQLVSKWGFDISELEGVDFPVVKKDQYEIAVLLPFLFDGFDNTSIITQNSLVMDMYQGMILAAQDLKAEGIKVNLNPYDTRRSGVATNKILNSKGFEGNDLIIGPLYREPVEAVVEYAKTKQINHFNPISSSSAMIGDSPFSYLAKPSYQTMALEMAKLASSEARNKNVMIFYEQSERDSLFAKSFRNQLEADSFKIVLYQEINKDNMNSILDKLSSQYDRYLSKSVADSINRISGRFVKERRARREELNRSLPIYYNEKGDALLYYEARFHMKPDSIGLILAATRSNLFANNLISVVETRGDSIKLYGYGDWLDFSMISLNQLDRLGVALSLPEYYNPETATYQDLVQRFEKYFKTKPSINHLRGYEMVYYAGKMLNANGRYFQTGLRKGTFKTAKVMEGFKYGAANDNQVAPVVRFNNAKLEVVNRESYEN